MNFAINSRGYAGKVVLKIIGIAESTYYHQKQLKTDQLTNLVAVGLFLVIQ